jgi:hypothetical protein
MLISHEVPIPYLQKSLEFNDYDYCLVHLMDEYPEYQDFYMNSVKNGRMVILDNSVFELGEAFDMAAFNAWVHKLKPSHYIIPDVIGNYHQTIDNIKTWHQLYPQTPGLSVGVLQGCNIREAVQCYFDMHDLVDVIAITSFNYTMYDTYHTNRLKASMLGRLKLCKILKELGNTKPIHLLGCTLPQEVLFHKINNFVHSMDTSNPVVHAINGISYKPYGLDDKVNTKLVEYITCDNIDNDILMHNIDKFREFLM